MPDIIDHSESFSIALDPTVEGGKGEIVNLDYPSSVEHGAQFDIDASVKNIGGAAALFRLELWVDGMLDSKSTFPVEPGVTSTDKVGPTDAPPSGTSMAIVIKCIRIT